MRKENSFKMEENTNVQDKGGFLWGLLGCCIPIVGLILFLVWKDTKPKTAKAARNRCSCMCCFSCYLLHCYVCNCGSSST